MHNNLLIISGPTCSGKSELAIKLAEELSGEIISMDSVQVYKGFDIGTAKLSDKIRDKIPHHLIDIREPNQLYNAQMFVDDAGKIIEDLKVRNKQPILVGGTTMYLTALLHGLAELPRRDQELRDKLSTRDQSELFLELQKIDRLYASKISSSDKLRTIRALETFKLTGQLPSDLLLKHAYGERNYKAIILLTIPDREVLYSRINSRTKAMLEAGLVDEVKTLRERFGDDIPGFKSIGYREVLDFINGKIGEVDLENLIAQNTRQYAKRQMTYWRNEPSKRGWRVEPEQLERAEKIKTFNKLDLSFSELIEKLRREIGSIEDNTVWCLG